MARKKRIMPSINALSGECYIFCLLLPWQLPIPRQSKKLLVAEQRNKNTGKNLSLMQEYHYTLHTAYNNIHTISHKVTIIFNGCLCPQVGRHHVSSVWRLVSVLGHCQDIPGPHHYKGLSHSPLSSWQPFPWMGIDTVFITHETHLHCTTGLYMALWTCADMLIPHGRSKQLGRLGFGLTTF